MEKTEDIVIENFQDYQNIAIDTKMYPEGLAIPYCVLGLTGEATELHEKITGHVKNRSIILIDDPKRVDLGKELGDVLWYSAALADEMDINITEDIEHPLFFAATSLDDMTNSICISTGKVAERVKKIIRDRHSIPDKEDKIVIQQHLTQIVRLSKVVSSQIGMYLRDVMIMNIEKLQSRKERGVLQGDGDDR